MTSIRTTFPPLRSPDSGVTAEQPANKLSTVRDSRHGIPDSGCRAIHVDAHGIADPVRGYTRGNSWCSGPCPAMFCNVVQITDSKGRVLAGGLSYHRIPLHSPACDVSRRSRGRLQHRTSAWWVVSSDPPGPAAPQTR